MAGLIVDGQRICHYFQSSSRGWYCLADLPCGHTVTAYGETRTEAYAAWELLMSDLFLELA